jgi:geranylgeranyl diphosphate synthase type I
MDIYSLIQEILSKLPEAEQWPMLGLLLQRKAAQKPRTWQLPVVACQAVGGEPARAVPASAALGCLQAAIILVDDMLDDDPRGEHTRSSPAQAANLAAACQSAGLAIIANCEASPETRLAVLASLNQMMLTTAVGQYLDIQNPPDEAGYWRLIRTKSSPYYAAGLHVGALLGGAAPQTAAQVRRLGERYGEMIQIHDDLNDTLAVPANPDWTSGRLPLPLLFAHVVDHPDRERFIELRRAMPDPEALAEAQTILIRCGAVSYCVDQLLRRHSAACEALNAMDLPQPRGLQALLDETTAPIQALFRSLGTPQPAEARAETA